MHRLLIAIFCLLGALACPVPAIAQDGPRDAEAALPHLGAEIGRTSVSGLSSGGFMAAQYAVAFSRTTIGAGIVAGGPYGCAMGGNPLLPPAGRALDCMAGHGISPAGGYMLALNYQMWGLVDPLENVRRQRLYLFHGTADRTVSAATMEGLRTFYANLKIPAAQIADVANVNAGHAFISQDAGHACAFTGPPFINRCKDGAADYDQSGAILRHIFGPPPASGDSRLGTPVAFDQRPYASALSSLGQTGYLYVPARCRDTAAHCAVHVVFHGCAQSADTPGIGDKVYAGLGYNRWAELYGLIVLYPQTTRAAFNPYGCWDWWGYDMKPGGAYLTREGTQLSAIHRMVEELAKPYE